MTTTTKELRPTEQVRPGDRPPPSSPAPLPAARRPLGSGAAAGVSVLLAVLLLALGVVAVRDAAVALGWLDGSALVDPVLRDGFVLTPEVGVLVGAVVAVVLGLALLLTALRRRPRNDLQVRAGTGVFIGRRDVARLADDAASSVDGVLSASSSVGRRSVTVHVRTTGADQTERAVQEQVEHRLRALTDQPTVKIRVRKEVS